MNGYDAIMQGRHGLRNAIQPTDMEYGLLLSVYSRLKRTRDEKKRRIEKERGAMSPTHIQIRRSVATILSDIHIARNDFAMYAASDEKFAILAKQLSRERKSDADRDLCARSVRTNELHVVHLV